MTELENLFKALADPTRLAVFECVRGCGGAATYDTETGECDGGKPNGVAACTVRCHVPCAPSTLTHHLNVLRAAGLIETERHGREVYARVLPAALDRLAAFAEVPVPCPTPSSVPARETAPAR